jgi:hypothetical protein
MACYLWLMYHCRSLNCVWGLYQMDWRCLLSWISRCWACDIVSVGRERFALGARWCESIKARTTFFWFSLIFYVGLSSKIARFKEPLQSAKVRSSVGVYIFRAYFRRCTLMTPTFVSEIRRVSFCVDRPKYDEPAYVFRNSVKLAYKNSCLSCQRLKYASGYQTGVPGKKEVFLLLREPVPISSKKAQTFSLRSLRRFNSSWQPIDLPNYHVRKADASSTAVLTMRPSSNTSEDQMYDWTSSNAINLGTQKIFCGMQTKCDKLRWDGSSS